MTFPNTYFIGHQDGSGKLDFLQKVGNFLLKSANVENEIPDLSRTLLVLPGQNAIRLLTDYLAGAGKGIFPPDSTTSGGLIRFGITEKMLTLSEQNQIWQQILREPETDDRCTSLFLHGLDRRNKKLITDLAENLSALQSELNRELLSFDVAKDILQDTTRWQDLADLEIRFHALLEKYNLPDPLLQLQNAVNDLTVFRDYEQIVIAGVPDLPKPAKERLNNLLNTNQNIQIHILINAPQEMAIRFDDWGVVKPEAWSGCPLNFEQGGRNRIHVAADPADLARLTRELLPVNGEFFCGKTVIATADPALTPWIKRELENVPGMPELYDPAGLPAGKLDLVPLLQLFCDLMAEPQIKVVRGLFAHRSFIAWLADACSATENDLLNALDAYRMKHLVDTLSDQAPEADSKALSTAFTEILKRRSQLCKSTNHAGTLRDLFNQIYKKTPSPILGVSFRQEAEKFSDLLEQFMKSPLLTDLTAPEFYETLVKAAEKLNVYPEHAANAVEITGFLDLPFRSAERIILCGVNEGILPETLVSTNFLNDTIRKKLGLPDNAQRFARDCFYLYTILKDAPESEFIVCKTDEKGTPLRASTLFFTDSEHLTERAGVLFAKPLPDEKPDGNGHCNEVRIEPDFTNAFGNKDNPEQIQLSVTAFKGLLDHKSILDTFFARSMKIDVCDYEATELDSLAFGTVCHAALEHFDIHSCAAEKDAVNTLCANFRRELIKKCGSTLPPAIQIQEEMFRNRMTHTAKKLFAEKDNYDFLVQEWALNGGEGILFHDILITGKIDRIEICRDRKNIRLIDFKTTDKGESPEKTHFKKAHNNKPARFLDLQLPLYRLLLPLDKTFWQQAGLNPDEVTFECGYFNIPKAVTETGYYMWPEMEKHLFLAENTVDAVRELIYKLRQAMIPEFTPGQYTDFADFYRPDVKGALSDKINWE